MTPRKPQPRYRTIVADPPWPLENTRMGSGGRRRRPTAVPYSFMTLDQIAALDVAAVADEDAVLFLWSTRRAFREGDACAVARAWDFEPCGEIVWGLRNPGMGSHALANDHEPVLVARRGKPALDVDRPLGVHFWRQRYVNGGKEHSAKPDGFLDFVETFTPAPRLEMFARRQRLGWDTWGNEALEHVEIA